MKQWQYAMDELGVIIETEIHEGVRYYSRIILEEVVLTLPKPPPAHMIEGWDLPQEEQFFRRKNIPDFWTKDYIKKRAPEFTKAVFSKGKSKTIIDYDWYRDDRNLEPRMAEYRDEEWRRRFQGHWFFNNGIAVYVTGHHYYYIEYWTMQNGNRPEFRDRDWIWYHFWDMCEQDGRCFGMIYPKQRREGATTKALAIAHNIISSTPNAQGGLQSKKDTDAKSAFKRMIKAKRRMPMFFRMIEGGMDNPERELKYSVPARRITHRSTGLDDVGEALESFFDYRSAKSEAYDGEALTFYIHDEAGKIQVPGVMFSETWETVKPALEMGINEDGNPGKALIPSTVGDREREGGKYFEEIFANSGYFDRNDNDETHSGLYRLFIPSYFGHEFFYDKYGMTVVTNPTPEQLKFLRNKYPKKAHIYKDGCGAYDYLKNIREGFRSKGNNRALMKHKRQFPWTWQECFMSDNQTCYFDELEINERIQELQAMGKRQPWITGNLKWKNGQRLTEVEFVESKKGRFKIAWFPENNEGFVYNNVSKKGRKYYPKNDNLLSAGLDPYDHTHHDDERLSTTQKAVSSSGHLIELEFGHAGKFSKAGFYGFRKFDPAVDMGKDEEDWESHNFFMEYVGRTREPETMWEDVLKFCWWCSVQVLVENQKMGVVNHFRINGCEEFIALRPDGITKSTKGRKPQITDRGVAGSRPLHEAMVEETERFLHYHVKKVPFIRYLVDCLEVDISPGKITKFDAFVGSSLALISARRKRRTKKREAEKRSMPLVRTYDIHGKRSELINYAEEQDG